jgi:iron complex outermembrane receptor protein
VFASSEGGSLDQGFFGFRYGGGNGTNLNYRVYSKAFSRGPEFHPDLQRFDGWRMSEAGFRTIGTQQPSAPLRCKGISTTTMLGRKWV